VNGAWDAIVIGGGHNALVAAAYLARTGRRVLVLERLGEPGGAAVSASVFAGRAERLSRYAYLVSLFPQRIARDLGIRLDLRTRAIAAYADGLVVDDDPGSARTAASFEAVTGSRRDHDAWLRFHAMTAAVARRLFPTLTEPLPSRARARALLEDVDGAWRDLVERPLGTTLRQRFDHGLVRGVVSTDALIGTFASIDEDSRRQNRCFLYHVIGGGDGRWRVPVGGMGAVSAALAGAAARAGAELRCGAEAVALHHGAATSEVGWIEDGREHAADARFVLAGIAPHSLAGLTGAAPGDPPEGSQTKLNLLLERLPRLRSGVAPEVAFAGTFRLNEHESQIAAAHRDAAAGRLPERAPAELYCHSLADRSILGPAAPEERHTLTLFGLQTPARLFRDNNESARDLLRERYLDALDEHLAEPIRDCIARDANGAPCVEAMTPLDLERELGMPGGHIFHGDLEWPWAEDGAEGGWGVETDHPRTLLCGAGARRGGGVSGIGGHNAAMALLRR
jgi:phytoene dehydrogenase-like protein